MIFIGNQRGGAKNLAAHLLSPDNEHVDVHEVRGFASDSVGGAFNEAYALSRGTRCKQFLFSLSVNPPTKEIVSTRDFESAIDRAEEKLGLDGQPRAIIFHEKNGRRHAHAVWSRIDTDEMKAVPLSFTHKKLQQVSKELFIEHGWQMPRGMVDKDQRDPKNFTLDEWQQAKRQGKDPRSIKTALQDSWATSDSKAAFAHALKERGFSLARGDRRGFVAIDRQGEVYAIGKKWLGVTTKAIKERLGDPQDLPNVETAKQQIACDMQRSVDRWHKELLQRKEKLNAVYQKRKTDLIEKQRLERKGVFEKLETRRINEARERQSRFRKGVKGLWDRLRGEHKRIQVMNEKEAYQAHLRDRAVKDRLVFQQLDQRRKLDAIHAREQDRLSGQSQSLERDARRYQRMQKPASKQDFMDRRQSRAERSPARARGRHMIIEF